MRVVVAPVMLSVALLVLGCESNSDSAGDVQATDIGGASDSSGGRDTGGGSDLSGGTDPGSDSGQVASVTVTPENGGTLQAPNGEATLVIPPGAVAAETTITASVLASTPDTVSVVYDFGPDGLTFQVPANLTVEYKGLYPRPDNKEPVLAWFDQKSNQWTPIAGSQFQKGVGVDLVKAPVEHFTRFAIVLRDGQVIVEGCVQEIDGFQACGGDPTGRWKFQDACMQLPLGGGGGECPGMTQGGDIEFVNLTLDFQNGQVTSSMDKTVVTIELTVPKSCLPGVPCSALEQDGELTCSDTGTTCSCTGTQEGVPEDSPNTKAYSVSGGDIVIGDQTSKFCIQGDELRMLQEDPEDGNRLLIIMKRQ